MNAKASNEYHPVPSVKLAIVDDHQIVIDGLKLLLLGGAQYQIIAESTSAANMLLLLKMHKPDLLITDIMMPDMTGFELAMEISRQQIPVKVLALSMNEEGDVVTKMIDEAKVDGYIPKASGKNELIKAIDKIISGGTYYAPPIISQYELFKKIKQDNTIFNLTGRELQIIECISQHLSNKDIANKLFISERTVETHRKNIYRKTNTKGEATLVKFAREHNLIK